METEIRGAQCTQCRAVKPMAEFKRTLTRAQSLARGYAGTHKVDIESTLCSVCQPKPKPISKLSRRELQTRAASGDLHPLIAKFRQATLVNHAHLAQVENGHNRARNVRQPAWDALIKPVQKEIYTAAQQEKYALKHAQPTLVTFFRAYIETLKTHKTKLQLQQRLTNAAPEKGVTWVEAIPKEVIATIHALWVELPIRTRVTRRLPAVLDKPAVDALVPYEHKRSTQMSAEERLRKV